MRRILLFYCLALVLLPLAPAQAQTANCLATPNSAGCLAGLPAAQYNILLDEMFFRPRPEVEFLPVNEQEVYRFAFRQLINPNGTTLYNAPGGAVVRSLPPGETLVTVQGYQDGWVKVNDGEWVQEADTEVVNPSTFAGARLTGSDYPHDIAWVLLPTHPSPYPGAEADSSRPRVERYTPVYIFATVEVGGWNWYLIGPDHWIEQRRIAKAIFIERPAEVKGRWFAVDLYEQVLVAYEEDKPVFVTLISSGLPDYPTLEGTWRTWSRWINTPMDGAEGREDFYSVENVPFVMYYDESYALHAAYWHDAFGYRKSRGCVNLSLTDAHWIYDWSLEGGYEYPWVHIWSSGQYEGE